MRSALKSRSRHGVSDEDSHSDAACKASPAAVREGGMVGSMRVKTSVTIDERVLRGIDKATTRTRSRSRVIEDAAREFLARRQRAARESRDREILDGSADALNHEMEDVLAYQADV